ncbi:hypothetical protein [Paenibacillus riograndensis]|uniref:hypothetical protein n=1 Tax=Paenibacillus riograndensis TaxID=483937 RepID=UPI001E5D305B|nr:hypothetical protein [Paenibacillus riograndensis]
MVQEASCRAWMKRKKLRNEAAMNFSLLIYGWIVTIIIKNMHELGERHHGQFKCISVSCTILQTNSFPGYYDWSYRQRNIPLLCPQQGTGFRVDQRKPNSSG